MSQFHIQRHLRQWNDIRENRNLSKYRQFAEDSILVDMNQTRLMLFNRDSYGVDVVRRVGVLNLLQSN